MTRKDARSGCKEVNAGGLETLPHDKQMIKSVVVAIDEWKANCVRVPMNETFWYGKSPYQKDGGKEYREIIDQIITLAAIAVPMSSLTCIVIAHHGVSMQTFGSILRRSTRIIRRFCLICSTSHMTSRGTFGERRLH